MLQPVLNLNPSVKVRFPNMNLNVSATNSKQKNQSFQSFLDDSTYIRKPKQLAIPPLETSDITKDSRRGSEQFNNYFESNRKEKSTFNILNLTGIRTEPDSPTAPAPAGFYSSRSQIKTDISELKTNNTNRTQKDDEIELLDCMIESDGQKRRLDSFQLDKNARKLIENMQMKLIKSEQENRKLKQEILNLNKQNKNLQNIVSGFSMEQTNFMKIKEEYEKRILKLQENFKDTDEIAIALKSILSLQEDELIARIAKKNNVEQQAGSRKLTVKLCTPRDSLARSSIRGSVKPSPRPSQLGEYGLNVSQQRKSKFNMLISLPSANSSRKNSSTSLSPTIRITRASIMKSKFAD